MLTSANKLQQSPPRLYTYRCCQFCDCGHYFIANLLLHLPFDINRFDLSFPAIKIWAKLGSLDNPEPESFEQKLVNVRRNFCSGPCVQTQSVKNSSHTLCSNSLFSLTQTNSSRFANDTIRTVLFRVLSTILTYKLSKFQTSPALTLNK